MKLSAISCVLFSLWVRDAVSGPPLHLSYPEKNDLGERRNDLRELLGNASTKARLPLEVVPISYKLDITPILDPLEADFLTAPGHVTIHVQCKQTTTAITLHIFEISIGDITVVGPDGEQIAVSGSSENPNAQTLRITVAEPLVVDEIYEISIAFISRVADDRLDGLYLSQYTDAETNVTNYHAATQFQSVGARRAFPCFDEPALRATFEIRLGRKEIGFHTLCNMDLLRTIPLDGRDAYVWDEYPPTVTMPTYLLAIVVSDFRSETAPEEMYRKPVKVWGPIPNMESSDATFTTETGARMLTFFEEYFDFEYEMPKMDSVAVPQFAAGAMENWGLNLYRVQYLLFTEGESTLLDKWRMASVLGHELTHQWFGNLVTFRWWNDIWLSEGFANYFQFIAANAIVPEFSPLERTGIDASWAGLEFDGGLGAVPIRSDDETQLYIPPSQIIYQKGSSIIRMMQGFLTEGTLQGGLQDYLREKSYGSAVQDELFEFLTRQALSDETLTEYTVKEIMDTWTTQPGFPLIRVSQVSQNRVYISQERFSNDAKFSLDPFTWYVPIAYTTQSHPSVNDSSLQPKTWMTPESIIISHTVETTDEWMLLNPDAKGHFRVLYDEHFTGLLKEQLEVDHSLLSPLSRAQLIDDYFKGAYGEYISLGRALELTIYLNAEDSLPVWSAVFNNIKLPFTVLVDGDEGEEFNTYLLSKVGPALERVEVLPVADETPVAMFVRTQLLDWACALGDESCYTTATDLFDTWMTSPSNPIPTDLQPMLYCGAVHGGQIYRDFILEQYMRENVTSRQQSLLLNAIACGTSPLLLTEALSMAINEESGIRSGDATVLMQKVAENSAGRQLAFDFINDNVDAILQSRVGAGGISAIMSTLSNYFATTARRTEVQKYLEVHGDKFPPELIAAINSALIKIDSNIDWMYLHGPAITEFLDSTPPTKLT